MILSFLSLFSLALIFRFHVSFFIIHSLQSDFYSFLLFLVFFYHFLSSFFLFIPYFLPLLSILSIVFLLNFSSSFSHSHSHCVSFTPFSSSSIISICMWFSFILLFYCFFFISYIHFLHFLPSHLLTFFFSLLESYPLSFPAGTEMILKNMSVSYLKPSGFSFTADR